MCPISSCVFPSTRKKRRAYRVQTIYSLRVDRQTLWNCMQPTLDPSSSSQCRWLCRGVLFVYCRAPFFMYQTSHFYMHLCFSGCVFLFFYIINFPAVCFDTFSWECANNGSSSLHFIMWWLPGNLIISLHYAQQQSSREEGKIKRN